MRNTCVINICNTIFLLGIVLTCTYTLTLTMDAHAFNAPASRRIIGYQCKNPRCGKFFCKCFQVRVRAAPQPFFQGGNSLRESHNAPRTHRSTPCGPFRSCSQRSSTPRFGWIMQRTEPCAWCGPHVRCFASAQEL